MRCLYCKMPSSSEILDFGIIAKGTRGRDGTATSHSSRGCFDIGLGRIGSRSARRADGCNRVHLVILSGSKSKYAAFQAVLSFLAAVDKRGRL